MNWIEFGPDDGTYTGIIGMDPAAEWLLGPGIQDYLPDGESMLIPFIMNLYDEREVERLRDRIKSESEIFIPPVYERTLKAGEYFTAVASKTFFDELANSDDGFFRDLRNAPKEIKLGAPLKASALSNWKPGQPNTLLDDPPVGPPEGGWPSETVVIGIIDDGIAFAHERFRTREAGSRVQCFWRMDPPNTSTTVEFGHEIWKEVDSSGNPAIGSIDALLLSSTVAGWLDEDQFYRSAKLIDFADPGHKGAAWRISHGTHVLDIAAGEDPDDNVLNRPIIGVQLPIATTGDTSGGSDFKDRVLRAIAYILQRADALGGGPGSLRVVINFSYGLIAGPHDGTSELERALDAMVQARPDKLRFVLPAGNSHLSRCHAKVKFTQLGQVVDLAWRVQPDDQTPSLLEIWLPHEGAMPPSSDRIRLSVVTPGGLASSPLGETHNTGVHLLDDNGEIICAASYVFDPIVPTQRGRFLVELQPTVRLQPTTDPVAPSGVWTIKLHNVSLKADQQVHAWIQRDDAAYGYPTLGRQSYFDQLCYVRFDPQGRAIEEDSHAEQVASPCHVKRAGLINAIATGAETIVLGGFVRKDFRPARYSAGGPITPKQGGTLDPNYRKPDAMAVSEDSKVHAGVLAAGSRSGSVVALNGTSVAAPQITRWIAGELAAGNPGDRNAVKALAIAEDPPSPPAPELPADRGGWGRITPPPGASIRRYVI